MLTKVNLVGDLQDTPRDLLELARDLKSLEKRLIPLLEDFALRLTVAGMSDESARYTAMVYSSQKAMGDAKRDLNVVLRGMRMKTVSQIDSVSFGSGSVSLIDPHIEYMKSPFQGDSKEPSETDQEVAQSNLNICTNPHAYQPSESALEYNQTYETHANEGNLSSHNDLAGHHSSSLPTHATLPPHELAFGNWRVNPADVQSAVFDPRVIEPNLLANFQSNNNASRMSNDEFFQHSDELRVLTSSVQLETRDFNNGSIPQFDSNRQSVIFNDVNVPINPYPVDDQRSASISRSPHSHSQGHISSVHLSVLNSPQDVRRPWTPDHSHKEHSTPSNDAYFSARKLEGLMEVQAHLSWLLGSPLQPITALIWEILLML